MKKLKVQKGRNIREYYQEFNRLIQLSDKGIHVKKRFNQRGSK